MKAPPQGVPTITASTHHSCLRWWGKTKSDRASPCLPIIRPIRLINYIITSRVQGGERVWDRGDWWCGRGSTEIWNPRCKLFYRFSVRARDIPYTLTIIVITRIIWPIICVGRHRNPPMKVHHTEVNFHGWRCRNANLNSNKWRIKREVWWSVHRMDEGEQHCKCQSFF